MKTPLTTNKLAQGIERCIISAHDLYRTASHTSFSPPGAISYALGILSQEEYGKIGWLFWAVGLRTINNQETWQYFWKKYTDHQHKIKIGFMLRHRATTDSLIPGIEDYFVAEYPLMPTSPAAYTELRESLLYLDYDHKTNSFLGPREKFGDKVLATNIT